jgi:hypothetical protein
MQVTCEYCSKTIVTMLATRSVVLANNHGQLYRYTLDVYTRLVYIDTVGHANNKEPLIREN